MERAIERGPITHPADYLERIIRFQGDGAYVVTKLESEDE